MKKQTLLGEYDYKLYNFRIAPPDHKIKKGSYYDLEDGEEINFGEKL